MRRALSLILFAQVISGLVWTLAIAGTPGRGDFGLLGLLVIVYAVQLAGALVGLWALWRNPALRRLAGMVVASPVVFWFLPGIVKTMAGGHLSSAEAATTGLVGLLLVVLASLIFPRRVAVLLPGFLFRSRLLNGLLLTALLLGWLLPVGILVFVFSGGGNGTGGDTGEGLALAIVLGATWLIIIGGLSVLGAAWGWLGWRSGVEGACRKLHIAQIVAATPAGLMGAAALAFMGSQG